MSYKRKRTGRDPQQLTLFSYQIKKSKVENDCHTSGSSDCDSKESSDEGDLSDSDGDSTGVVNKTKVAVSGDDSTVYQDNHITLDKPSGSMTIIINNRSSTPATSSMHAGQNPGQSSSSSTPSQSSVTAVPSDISVGAHQAPVQPCIRYPSTLTGTKRRSFNYDWFEKYCWLEYSKERDAAFCYACRIFSVSAIGKKSDVFTCSGFRDWKHATGQNGSLAKHDSSYTHKQAMLSWAEFVKNANKNTSIGDRLDSTRRQQIQENRCYLKTIAEIILLCARQDLVLRGHRESRES